jgi:carbon-monoxide dehydrogenase medium subunit
MHAFEYIRADSVAQAAALLSQHSEAKLLAGGMTLIPSLKHRLAQASHLIDLAEVAGLQTVELQPDSITLGAGLRHQDVADSETVKTAIPALAALAGQIGDPQVRARGTLGGSVANNDPAADYPAALLALGATVLTDQREIAAQDFFLGMFSTALQSSEVVRAVRFPIPKKAAYAKFRHPASGYAMAGVFVAELAPGDRRVAITGATDGVCRWPEAEAAWAKGLTAAELNHPGILSDIHAPASYRAHLASVMFAKALASLS